MILVLPRWQHSSACLCLVKCKLLLWLQCFQHSQESGEELELTSPCGSPDLRVLGLWEEVGPGWGGSPPASYGPSPPQPPPHSSLTASFLSFYQPPSFLPQGIYTGYSSVCRALKGPPSRSSSLVLPPAWVSEISTTIMKWLLILFYEEGLLPYLGSSKNSRALFVFFSTIIPGI